MEFEYDYRHHSYRPIANRIRQPIAISHQPTTQLVGRTKCDRIVVFDGNPRLAGTLADITLHDCTQTTLIGSIVTRHVQPGSPELLPTPR